MSKYIVTITPPTPNGDLHIGHIAGPFLAADIFARTQRQLGHDCVLLSYSDDYQSYMLRKGLELKTDPVALARANTARIERSLAATGIHVDHWMRPYDNPHFRQAVTEVFDNACVHGAVEFKESLEPYCPDCDVWGYEAFGRGLCNHCGHDSDASQCEACAQAPDATKMADLHCKLCGRHHQWRSTPRAFLKLSAFRGLLREGHSHQRHRVPLDQWLHDTIEHHLDDWGITRPGDAGLDLATDGSCRVHTWFMGLAGYMAAFREYAEKTGAPELFDDYWCSGQGELVHFLGFDCVYSHAIVYPVLLSLQKQLRVKQRFLPNQFLKLDGLNLSTSRNHAIWVSDLVQQACTDSIRLYLASIAPEETEGDFRRDRFESWRKAVFSEFVPALLAAATQGSHDWWKEISGADEPLLQGLRRQWLDAAGPSHFSIKRMAQMVLDTIEIASGRLADNRPVAHFAALIATAGKALIPDTSKEIMDAFGLSEADTTAYLLNGSTLEYSI